MKRMICFISHQLLPNFIPVNEEATRPEALHAIFTPKDQMMRERRRLLKDVLGTKFPAIELHDVEVGSAYDAKDIQQKCELLIRDHTTDEWSLNMTGGTKLMSSPAVEVFRQEQRPIYYVETPRNLTLQISADWTVTEHPFTGSIDLHTYFELYERTVTVGDPKSGQEGDVYRRLRKLAWQIWPSVCLFDKSPSVGNPKAKGSQMAEYDAIAIRFYQLFAFECKRLTVTQEDVKKGRVHAAALARTKDDILFDLYKLSQIQQSFGGPFGKSYWVFSGDAKLREVDQARIKEFRITLVRGKEVQDIHRTPEKFGLPPLRGKVADAISQ
ncbi:MAG: DUF1887 family protein [Acidobacteria bacterium]|nr:DUF1887 family protein [Acidobacteriota bacterium]